MNSLHSREKSLYSSKSKITSCSKNHYKISTINLRKSQSLGRNGEKNKSLKKKKEMVSPKAIEYSQS